MFCNTHNTLRLAGLSIGLILASAAHGAIGVSQTFSLDTRGTEGRIGVSDVFTLDTRTSGSYSNVSGVFTLDTRAQSGSFSGISGVFTLDTRDDVSGNGLPDFWEYTYFGTTGSITLDGDEDGDGIPNILEFALGLDPNDASGTGNSLQTQIVEEGGETYLTYTFLRRKDNLALTYRVECSSNLTTWAWGSNVLEVIETTPINDSFEQITVKAKTPINSQSRQYLRLRVSD